MFLHAYLSYCENNLLFLELLLKSTQTGPQIDMFYLGYT